MNRAQEHMCTRAHVTRRWQTAWRKDFFVLLCLATCALLSGCGYTTSSSLSSNIKTVHVETFKNNVSYTSESGRNLYLPLLEVDARNAIINRFLFDGNLKITDPETADLILKGELTGYQRSALRVDDADDVQEYRVHIVVNLECRDGKTNEVLWTENGFTGEATYFTTGALATTEEGAVTNAIIDLARRIVERTIENW